MITPLSTICLTPGSSIHALAGTASVVNILIFGTEQSPDGTQSTNKLLSQAVLGTSDSNIYVANGVITSISSIMLANTSASIVSGVALGFNGTAATAANQFLSSTSIPANGQAIFVDGVLRVYDSGGNLQQAGAANTAFDSTIPAITTPLALSTAGTAVTAPHRDHTHQSPGGVAAITAATAGIVDTETQIVGATIPATLLRAGTVLNIQAYGTITSTVNNDVTFNVRIGTTTLTGNIPAAITSKPGNAGTVTAAPFLLSARITIRTAGASGTVYGVGSIISVAGTTGQALAAVTVMFTPASVAVDMTAIKICELTCVTAAATSAVTVQSAQIDIVKM